MSEALGTRAAAPVAAVPLYQADRTPEANVAAPSEPAEPTEPPPENPVIPEIVAPPPTPPEEEPEPQA